jgi:hypothetical protein
MLHMVPAGTEGLVWFLGPPSHSCLLLCLVCTCFCAQGVVHSGLRIVGRGGSTAPVPAIPTQAGPGQVAPSTQARFKITGPCKEVASERTELPLFPSPQHHSWTEAGSVPRELGLAWIWCHPQQGSYLAGCRAHLGGKGRPEPCRSAPHLHPLPQTPPARCRAHSLQSGLHSPGDGEPLPPSC